MKVVKVLQIIPATGWSAVYQFGHHEEVWPLAMWALVEIVDETTPSEVETVITGVDQSVEDYPGLDYCLEVNGFLRYQPEATHSDEDEEEI